MTTNQVYLHPHTDATRVVFVEGEVGRLAGGRILEGH